MIGTNLGNGAPGAFSFSEFTTAGATSTWTNPSPSVRRLCQITVISGGGGGGGGGRYTT